MRQWRERGAPGAAAGTPQGCCHLCERGCSSLAMVQIAVRSPCLVSGQGRLLTVPQTVAEVDDEACGRQWRPCAQGSGQGHPGGVPWPHGAASPCHLPQACTHSKRPSWANFVCPEKHRTLPLPSATVPVSHSSHLASTCSRETLQGHPHIGAAPEQGRSWVGVPRGVLVPQLRPWPPSWCPVATGGDRTESPASSLTVSCKGGTSDGHRGPQRLFTWPPWPQPPLVSLSIPVSRTPKLCGGAQRSELLTTHPRTVAHVALRPPVCQRHKESRP